MKGGRLLRSIIRILIIIAILLAVGFYFNIGPKKNDDILVNETNIESTNEHTFDESESFDMPYIKPPKEGLISLIGKSKNEIIKLFGEPERKDPSLYGFDWWIYPINYYNYTQIGIKGNKVVTIYATGSDVQIPPFQIGQSISDLYSLTIFEPAISINYQDSSYQFELSEDDLNTRPLVRIGDFFAQLYFDKFNGTLSGIRLLDTETLINQHPYEMVYRGEEPAEAAVEPIFEEQVERSIEKQIFEITNVFRVNNDLQPLEWDEKASDAAFAHSKDMYESGDFSHTSKEFGELADRLDAAEVVYEAAGENIAANYTDAPAVVEGWLNSKGHRESLLSDEFTHLGVGVYKKHYTQNFIEKLKE